MMQRTIKSFVIRNGRLSNRQQQGLLHHLSHYEIVLDDTKTPWDFETIFKRKADTIIEIGFGMGASLLTMAKAAPECNFIGIEVHKAGIGSLCADLYSEQLTNVRIVPHDAVQVFNQFIGLNSVSGIQIFFPDPWHKTRHHKRRLIQPDLIALLASRLKPQGFIHCATDWQEYAEYMLQVLHQNPILANIAKTGQFIPRPDTRPLTKFERRGQQLGHNVWDLKFIAIGEHF